MRVLKVADVPRCTPGGIHSFMVRSGRVLEEWGHEIDHLFHEDLFPRLIRGRRSRRLLLPWLVPLAVWRRQRARGRYDVVEIHEPIAAPYCLVPAWTARRALPPCVVVSYGAEERHWRDEARRARYAGRRRRRGQGLYVALLNRYSRWAFLRADHVLVPSADDARYLADELGMPSERLTRVDSGVGEEFFAVEASDDADSGARVLFAGTWCDKKGAPELVEAWRRVSAARPTATLSVTCTVADERTVMADFDAGADRVTVLPLLDDAELRAALAAHDVFVLPSWFEGGISLASLQAAAAGLPCIVTAIGGHEDLFRPAAPEEDGGLLVAPHDPAALAEAIERLLTDASLRRRLGEKARLRARSFSWRETARRTLDAYRSTRGSDGRIG